MADGGGAGGVGARAPTAGAWLQSDAAKVDRVHAVLRALDQHELRAGAGRQDVLAEVAAVDLAPDGVRGLARPGVRERGVAVEVRVGILEHGRPQLHEPLDVPAL